MAALKADEFQMLKQLKKRYLRVVMVWGIFILLMLYPMSNPAFIIDGFTEKLIVQKICPGKRVTRTDLNGKTVTIDAIAKKISSLIRALGNKYYPIIII